MWPSRCLSCSALRVNKPRMSSGDSKGIQKSERDLNSYRGPALNPGRELMIQGMVGDQKDTPIPGVKEEPRTLGRSKAMSRKEPGTFVRWECIPVPCLEPQYGVSAPNRTFQKGVARQCSLESLPGMLRPWVPPPAPHKPAWW